MASFDSGTPRLRQAKIVANHSVNRMPLLAQRKPDPSSLVSVPRRSYQLAYSPTYPNGNLVKDPAKGGQGEGAAPTEPFAIRTILVTKDVHSRALLLFLAGLSRGVYADNVQHQRIKRHLLLRIEVDNLRLALSVGKYS